MNSSIISKIKESNGLVFYDGECGFCQFWVQFILRRDPNAYFYFAPLQSEIAKKLHGQVKTDWESILYLEKGEIFDRSTAALKIIQKLGWPYKLLALFWIVPRPLRDWVYDHVAQRRKSLGFEKECYLPTPQERKQFLGDHV